jgi:hypothetical protein
MDRDSLIFLTEAEVLKLSDQALDAHIESVRAKTSAMAGGYLRREAENHLAWLEVTRTKLHEREQARILPTISRAPVWKLTGYPIGAELISEALSGVPHYNDIDLWFSEYRQKSILAGMPLPILVAQYSYYRKHSHIMGSKPIRISIYAVPRTLKKVVRAQLHEKGLAKLRQWLIEIDPHFGQEGRATIEFELNDENEVTVIEKKGFLPARS